MTGEQARRNGADKRSRSWLAATGVWGVGFAAAAFVFQVTQAWADQGISARATRWVLPSSFSAIVLLVAGAAYLLLLRRHDVRESPAASDFATAVVGYADQLYQQQRYSALISLRNNISETLHILGFHEMRVHVGDLAFSAATILQDDVAKAWVLVDDLGWAKYLMHEKAEALANIDRAIEIAVDASASAPGEDAHRLALCHAKALRHKALIGFADEKECIRLLIGAEDVLLPLAKSVEMRREVAQLHHARALASAMRLGVHKVGFIRAGDTVASGQLDEALVSARTAARDFLAIRDTARHTKTIFLVVRLLEAKRADAEAREARILRDQALAQSAWATAQGISTLTGVE